MPPRYSAVHLFIHAILRPGFFVSFPYQRCEQTARFSRRARLPHDPALIRIVAHPRQSNMIFHLPKRTGQEHPEPRSQPLEPARPASCSPDRYSTALGPPLLLR